MAYLSIDIGSTAVKAAVIAEDGALIAFASRQSPLSHGSDGSHSSDSAGWISAVGGACEELMAGARGAELRAVSVSGNGPTLLPVGNDGQALGPALSWMDRRAIAEAAEVSRVQGFEIDPSFYLPKALMLWRSLPEAFTRLRWFFSCPEFVTYSLSGEAVTYLPQPGYKPYIWSEGSLSALGLPHDRFPRFAAPGEIVGRVTVDAAKRFGIPEGLPVVAGFPDFLASILGAAAVVPGIACDRGGTSEAMNICTTRPFIDHRLLSLPHAISGLWNISGGLSTAGKALEWLVSIGISGSTAELLTLAEAAQPGSTGCLFLPYLAGERAPLWDGALRGSFLGLGLDIGRGELSRAACESIAFGLRHSLELAASNGQGATLVRTSGASARTDFLNRLKADVFGVPVEVPAIEDCELVGDACASALAIGDADSLQEAASVLVRIDRRFEPDPLRSAFYDKAFIPWKAALTAATEGC